MVKPLGRPARPLPSRAFTWTWRYENADDSWQWCRIYHHGRHTKHGTDHRNFGPLARLDHHRPAQDGQPARDPVRTVLYVADNLATALGEVFGDTGEVAACPNYRIAILKPTRRIRLVDLITPTAAMQIDALPSLATADHPRSLTQEWARAIWDDQPARQPVHGIRYNTAHTNGAALALWNTDQQVDVATGQNHQPQDYSLTEHTAIWTRVMTAATSIRLVPSQITPSECPNCTQT